MYLFQISNYDDPAVDRETAELLHQRLEAESRRRYPAIWNAIDRIRTHAAKGPGREKRTVRYRIYGLFLLALGLLTLILGLMPPKTNRRRTKDSQRKSGKPGPLKISLPRQYES